MGAPIPGADYAGDLTSIAAWGLLSKEAGAQMVDVRTMAEWTFVGLPDLTSLGRQVLTVEWHSFGAKTVNPAFLAQTRTLLEAVGAGLETSLLLLCRSGHRSRHAAAALTKAGYKRAYNISDGFEGDLDNQKHRGQLNGWRHAGLPWQQS